MAVTVQDVHKIASLAHLRFTDEEVDLYTGQLNQILAYVEKLNELNTDDVEITYHPISYGDAFREDIPGESLRVEDALRNAPEKNWQYFVVPKVVG